MNNDIIRNEDAVKILLAFGVGVVTRFDWLPELTREFRTLTITRFCDAVVNRLYQENRNTIIDKDAFFKQFADTFLLEPMRNLRGIAFKDDTLTEGLIIAVQRLRFQGKCQALSIPEKFAARLAKTSENHAMKHLAGKYLKLF